MMIRQMKYLKFILYYIYLLHSHIATCSFPLKCHIVPCVHAVYIWYVSNDELLKLK